MTAVADAGQMMLIPCTNRQTSQPRFSSATQGSDVRFLWCHDRRTFFLLVTVTNFRLHSSVTRVGWLRFLTKGAGCDLREPLSPLARDCKK
jgi:hypothetical protein